MLGESLTSCHTPDRMTFCHAKIHIIYLTLFVAYAKIVETCFLFLWSKLC